MVPILCCVCVGCCIAQNVEPTGRRAQYVIQQPQRQQVMTETIGSPHVQYSIQHRHPISSVEAIVVTKKYCELRVKNANKMTRSEASSMCARRSEEYSKEVGAEYYKDCMKDEGF